MLHRAILGSLERFIGVYLEHTAARLPAWLAPTQVRILNVTDKQKDYCKELYLQLKQQGVRVHLDDRAEKLGFKIREAQLDKTPYMVIIGDNELDAQNISVRLRSGKNVNGISKDEFFNKLTNEILDRELTSPWEDK